MPSRVSLTPEAEVLVGVARRVINQSDLAILKRIQHPFPPRYLWCPMIIALMHSLPSVAPLLRELASHAFVLFVPKNYSKICIELPAKIKTVRVPAYFASGYVKELHKVALQQTLVSIHTGPCVLLDSGGLLTEEFDKLYPDRKRTSIQLTQSGCRKPIRDSIMIGSDPEKKASESRAICEAILNEARKVIDLGCAKVGIVGKGAIGQGMVELLPGSIHFSGFELSPEKVDILFGATGYDISDLALRIGAKHLFSCSSWDTEFNTLLRQNNCELSFEGGNCNVKIDDMTIYNAGCPMNFNRKQELEPYSAMAPVRQFTLNAALKALVMHRSAA